MARLSDLITTLSEAGGPTAASLTVIGRALREKGLVATGGRGASGAQMTPSDLANMLLALPALGDHTRAAEAVARVGSLRLLNVRDGKGALIVPEDVCPDLGICRHETLHAVLSKLISRLSLDEQVSRKEGSANNRSEYGSYDPFSTLDDEGEVWGDPEPISLTIFITKDGEYFSSDLLVQQKGGGAVRLDFRASRDFLRPDEAGDASRGGIEAIFRVKPEIVAAATRCIRAAAQTSNKSG